MHGRSRDPRSHRKFAVSESGLVFKIRNRCARGAARTFRINVLHLTYGQAACPKFPAYAALRQQPGLNGGSNTYQYRSPSACTGKRLGRAPSRMPSAYPENQYLFKIFLPLLNASTVVLFEMHAQHACVRDSPAKDQARSYSTAQRC